MSKETLFEKLKKSTKLIILKVLNKKNEKK